MMYGDEYFRLQTAGEERVDDERLELRVSHQRLGETMQGELVQPHDHDVLSQKRGASKQDLPQPQRTKRFVIRMGGKIYRLRG